MLIAVVFSPCLEDDVDDVELGIKFRRHMVAIPLVPGVIDDANRRLGKPHFEGRVESSTDLFKFM